MSLTKSPASERMSFKPPAGTYGLVDTELPNDAPVGTYTCGGPGRLDIFELGEVWFEIAGSMSAYCKEAVFCKDLNAG